MNNTITAQELKTKGAQLLKEKMKNMDELIITVRGQKSFVVLTMEQYAQLRENDILSAFKESQEDIKHGRYKMQTAKEHMKELRKELKRN